MFEYCFPCFLSKVPHIFSLHQAPQVMDRIPTLGQAPC